MSLEVGQYCKIKNGLQLGKKYGTVTYTNTIKDYLGRLLQITRISSTGTAYCVICKTGEQIGTFHESMLDFPKFELDIGYEFKNSYSQSSIKITKITIGNTFGSSNYEFGYHFINKNSEKQYMLEPILEKCIQDFLNNEEYEVELINVNENENRLQEQEANLSGRDRLTGRRIQSRTNKATISSRPLRNPKSIRGK